MATAAFGQTARIERVPLTLAAPEALLECGRHLYHLIVQRAYQLYEARGRANGQDVSDWLQAEAEIVSPCRHNTIESPEAILFRIDLPGNFAADQVTVSVEPRRLIVCAQREIDIDYSSRNETVTKHGLQRLFHIQNLPAEVDPSMSRAMLGFETLEIEMAKRVVVQPRREYGKKEQDPSAETTLLNQVNVPVGGRCS
ncbi:MAG TPA: DUF2934 domain-containing protein [Candidatus Dormibacteraeota bacterium]|nr:DUF2934 domain-containing protein [Candidatus Dormibacteraeota bacterium]